MIFKNKKRRARRICSTLYTNLNTCIGLLEFLNEYKLRQIYVFIMRDFRHFVIFKAWAHFKEDKKLNLNQFKLSMTLAVLFL